MDFLCIHIYIDMFAKSRVVPTFFEHQTGEPFICFPCLQSEPGHARIPLSWLPSLNLLGRVGLVWDFLRV